MSDFKFPCPKCGQSILCDTSNAGMQIPCPACKVVLTVPPPPPPPPAAGPAKLSINKAAHVHSAPPPPVPGAANAPAKPAWGTKPERAPKPKKKFPVKAVSIVIGVIVVALVGWFGFYEPYLKEQAAKKKQQEEAAARQAAEDKAKAEAAAEKVRRARASYSLELANVPFPERNASGKHHGADFKVETVIFQNGFLTLRQDTGTVRQFVISIPVKTGEPLSGKSFQVATTNTVSVPRVVMNWKDDGAKLPSTLTFSKGYAMKLEFGTTTDGQTPGKIFLAIPDPEQSFVAGDFQIGPKKK